jgi:FkbM family methyltransferase
MLPIASVVASHPTTRSIASKLSTVDVRLSVKASGVVLRTPLLDAWPAFEVFALREYDFPELAWKEFRWIVDCGAHVGSFSLWAAGRSDARIVAVEPNPSAYRLLEQNLAPLTDRVSITRAAVAGSRGERVLEDTGFPALSSISRAPGVRGFKVEAITLQDLVTRNQLPQIDMLKMDIEGAEQEIFQTLPFDTLAKTKAAVIECHPDSGTDVDLIEAKLRRVGLSVRKEPRLIVSWRT